MSPMPTKSPLILPFEGKTPRIHKSAWIAPTATIIGDVEIGPDASVFYGVVLRGGTNKITIGARSNIQDNSVFHCDADAPATLEEDVTIGHMALVDGAYVGEGSLIGMHAAMRSRSPCGAGALLVGGAVVVGSK